MSTSPDIFLSYSRKDQVVARRFAEAFKAAGFTVWWDVTLRSGETYDRVTENALRDAKVVVVLWSKKSVDSDWVRAEATIALRNRTLMPVMIEACQRPIMFELTHTADLIHWKGDPSDLAWHTYVADVRQFVDKGESRPTAAPAPGMSRGPTSRRLTRRAGIVLVLFVAAVVAIVGLHFNLLQLLHAPAGKPAAVSVAATDASLAVLPFADLSPQHDQEYFSDGLSEELLTQLAQVMDLKVTARTSSFSFKGLNVDVRVIAQKLGVNHLLEGSVRKDGSQLRITAQLINAATGVQVWTQTYDRKLENIFSIQEDIAKDVARALSIKLDVGEMSLAKGGTTNIEAYDRYLRARTFDRQDSLELAIQLYREAVGVDPKFARAWAALYGALNRDAIVRPADSDAIRKEMSEISTRLAALAPDAWFTHSELAFQLMNQHRWSDAVTASNAALASAPSSENMAASYGVILGILGRAKEGLGYTQSAHAVDPLSLSVSQSLQIALDLAGHPEEAQAEYERSKGLAGPRDAVDRLAFFRLWSRMDADPMAAKAGFRRQLQILRQPSINGVTPDNMGNKQVVLASLHQSFASPAVASRGGATLAALLAEVADTYGDRDLALTALRRSFLGRDGVVTFALWQFNKSGLRGDPRFKQLLRDLKLVDYFRASGKWNDFCHPVGADDFECE